ncbi:MAG: DsrE family protein [Bacteroidales bacterium]|nr:DsrE family protein [Bacteroidales bacterium]
MKTQIGLMLLAGSLMVSCMQQQQPETPAASEMNHPSVKDGIFIHITAGADDPHRVLMPLKMATLMAPDKDVLVYMDIDAVKLVVKDAADVVMEGFDPMSSYLKKLSEMNIGVYACPTCLAVAGFTPEDLKEGILTADKERFFSFTKGRILTIDY